MAKAVPPHIRRRLEAEAAAAAAANAVVDNTCSAGLPPQNTTNANEHHDLDTPTLAASTHITNNSATVPVLSPMSASVPQPKLVNTTSTRSVSHNVSSVSKRANAALMAPARILCAACKTVKPKDQFSPKQLDSIVSEMKRNRHFQASRWSKICCKACNAEPTELKCSGCGITKPKAEYNKTQWRLRKEGTADCKWCCKEIQEAELPGLQDEDIAHHSSSDQEEGGAPLMGSSSAGGNTIDDSDESSDGEDWTIPQSSAN